MSRTTKLSLNSTKSPRRTTSFATPSHGASFAPIPSTNLSEGLYCRRAYDNTLPAPQTHTPSTLHGRHLDDTAARMRRASRASSSSTPPFTPRAHAGSHAHTDPHFARRPHDPPSTHHPSHTPLPGARDRHHRHPGQRYTPPDPTIQRSVWAAQQEALREQKTRGPRYMASIVLGFTALLTVAWFLPD